MNLEEAMAELLAMGTEQNRKIYARHGAGDNQFGVSFANLNKLKKRIKKDQALAEALWQTGNADARGLATLIADPQAMRAEDLDRWLQDAEAARYYMLPDLIARHVAARGPLARDRMQAWTGSPQEYLAQGGWDLLAILAMEDAALPDDFFEPYLQRIETSIHDQKNRVRHAMNEALIAIGLRNPSLRQRAEAIAATIGKVQVDHGETGCKTPDAAAYIAKTWARKTVAA